MQRIELSYIHPINEQESLLIIKENLDYKTITNTINFKNDNDIINQLNYLLKCIDCTIIYDCGPNCIIDSYSYNEYISLYWYYIKYLKNQILYNQYLDKLIKRHIDNIIFTVCTDKPKIKKKEPIKKKKVKNEFIRQETRDIFTGEISYQYVNLKTNEIINSKDENLLEELNSKNKKKSKKESKIVPMFGITFNFNKK